MRYRIGEAPGDPALALDQVSFLAIAILSLVIGTGFIFAGVRSRHYWMASWGTGLMLSSLVYIMYVTAVI
jgi:hypothetical protein